MKEEINNWSKELKRRKVRKAKLYKVMEGMSNRKNRKQTGRRKKKEGLTEMQIYETKRKEAKRKIGK